GWARLVGPLLASRADRPVLTCERGRDRPHSGRRALPREPYGGAVLDRVIRVAPGLSTHSDSTDAALGPSRPASAAPALVRVYHAGSVNAVIDDLGAGFTAATGYRCEHLRGPSGVLAEQMKRGEIEPDVFVSADAETNLILMGAENGDLVRWYVLVA